MVGYMAMLIQHVAGPRPRSGYDSAYALAAIAPVPLWLASLSLLIAEPAILFLAVRSGGVGGLDPADPTGSARCSISATKTAHMSPTW